MKKKSKIKRIFKGIGIAVLGFVLALFLLPYFFKDEIVSQIKEEINNNVNAEVQFGNVDLSFFRSFPDLQLSINDITIFGLNEFENHTLFSSESIKISLDLVSAIRKDEVLKLNEIIFDTPELNVLILENGNANYQIAKTDSSKASNTNMSQLEHYEIKNGSLIYSDRSSNIELTANSINHSGSGQFNLEEFDLSTKTNMEKVNLTSSSIPFITNGTFNNDGVIQVNAPLNEYRFTKNNLQLNELEVLWSGLIKNKPNAVFMDMNFESIGQNFKSYLSAIPYAYTENFDNVEANGNASLSAVLKGDYSSEKDIVPNFNVDLNIQNANFKYPQKSKSVDQINATIDLSNQTGKLKNTRINIPQFDFKIENNPFKGSLSIMDWQTDPNLEATLNGKLILEDIAEALPMTQIEKLEGSINTDAFVDAKLSDISNKNFDSVDCRGTLKSDKVSFKSKDKPEIILQDIDINADARKLVIKDLNGSFGESDALVNLELSNPLAYFVKNKIVSGKLVIQSDFWNIDEWQSNKDSTNNEDFGYTVTIDEKMKEVIDGFDIGTQIKVNEILYQNKKLNKLSAIAQIKANEFDLKEANLKHLKSNINVQGMLQNLYDYLFNSEVLKGYLSMSADNFDFNNWFEESEETSEQKYVYKVPKMVDIQLNADIDQLTYTNIEFSDIKGSFSLNNEKLILENVTTTSLGGKMKLDGFYDSSIADEPRFALVYDLSQLDFQKTFSSLETFRALAPIAQYIKGFFNAKLEMSGELDDKMFPVLSTLTASGFLETKDGIISGSKPLTDIANKLQVESLKGIRLTNTINFFEVINGLVQIDPFEFNHDDIDFYVDGAHSIKNQLDYHIVAKIPKSKISKSELGSTALKGLDFLMDRANALGLDLENGDYIDVDINISGHILDPKIKITPLGASGIDDSLEDRVKEELKKEIDDKLSETKDTINTIVDEKKTELENKVNETIEDVRDTLTAAAQGQIDSLKTKAKDVIKDKAGSVLDTLVGTSKKDSLEAKLDKVLDNLIKKNKSKDSTETKNGNIFNRINPFKKKKIDN